MQCHYKSQKMTKFFREKLRRASVMYVVKYVNFLNDGVNCVLVVICVSVECDFCTCCSFCTCLYALYSVYVL